SRISVRDASYLYEVEIREGAPRRATRTSGDGNFERGERVIASLLGVGAARFVVTASSETVEAELLGTLQAQLAGPISAARGAAQVLCGARTISVDRVLMDMQQIGAYLHSTPEPARGLIERIANSGSPRQMLLAAEVEPALLEDVLVDLAVKGMIRGVRSVGGDDLLGPAIEAAYAKFQGATSPRAKVTAPVPESAAIALAKAASEEREKRDSSVPSSLADAVMRELSHRSPDPGGARHTSSTPPPIVEPSELRKRVSSDPPSKSNSNPAPAVHVVPGTDVDLVYELDGFSPSLPVVPKVERSTDDVAANESRPSWTDDQPKTPFTSVAAKNLVEPLPMKSRGWLAWVGLAVLLLVIAAGIRFNSGPSVAGGPSPDVEPTRLPAVEAELVSPPLSPPVTAVTPPVTAPVSVSLETVSAVSVSDASQGDAGKVTMPAL
ncbi:MAG: hypothetical protein ABIP39_06765, partial [Polyangiaceae bacterium]